MLTPTQLRTAQAYNRTHAPKNLPMPLEPLATDGETFAIMVATYQAANGLAADGCLGPKTLAKMATTPFAAEHSFILPIIQAPLLTPPTGIDVSGWNDPGDFSKIKAAGHSFVFIKVSEGNSYFFNKYASWKAQAQAQGLLVGPYHFAQPTLDPGDAKKEAAWFYDKAGPWCKGELPPVLDFELNKATLPAPKLIQWGLDFLVEAERLFGVRPIFYTYLAFWKGSLRKTSAFEGYPLWVAQYPHVLPTATTAAPSLGSWLPSFWQYGCKHVVPGLPGHFDINRCYLTPEQLSTLVGL